MEFGRQMRLLRTAQNKTLLEMGQITGIQPATLNQYEARGMQILERHMNLILIGYHFPPAPLREIAFGILEGTIDRPMTALAMLEELETTEAQP